MAVLISWSALWLASGDGEGTLCALHVWSLTVLPATLVLGFASVGAYDLISRVKSASSKVFLMLLNCLIVVAIPYAAMVVVAEVGSR